jgi:hypothetical protein
MAVMQAPANKTPPEQAWQVTVYGEAVKYKPYEQFVGMAVPGVVATIPAVVKAAPL